MKRAFLGAIGALATALTLALGAPAFAQQTPTGTWGSSTYFKSPLQQSVDDSAAEAMLRARMGGYGPSISNSETNYWGDVTNNDYSTYNGPVQNTSTTNAVNLTTYQTRIDQTGSTGASSGVTYTTGNTAGPTNQTAQGQTSSVGTGNNSQAASGANGH